MTDGRENHNMNPPNSLPANEKPAPAIAEGGANSCEPGTREAKIQAIRQELARLTEGFQVILAAAIRFAANFEKASSEWAAAVNSTTAAPHVTERPPAPAAQS